MIQRIGPSRLSATRGRSVIYNGVVTTVATSDTKEPSLYAQARDALARIDRNLIEAGTERLIRNDLGIFYRVISMR
jgi:enamine deaminase RidA (YjgF/YER057c/UK114 family)